jgi:rhodanese-related sulfurtransferase
MRWLQFFRKVNSMDAPAARAFMEDLDGAEFNLVDVRQPGEYKKGHLPGAMLIPMGDLEERCADLDPTLPTLVY